MALVATVLLAGWGLAAVVCWRWSVERTAREAAESLNRSLLAANAEKTQVIEMLAREQVAKLSDRMFALLPADDRADAWSHYEAM